MWQLVRCALCFGILCILFTIWGYSVGKQFKINIKHLPMQTLCGFFAFFIVAQIIILPVVFFHNSMSLATVLLVTISGVFTALMLIRDKFGWIENIKQLRINAWTVIVFVVTACTMLVALGQQYVGYDTCYYIGQMNAFTTYGQFWTRDAFEGMRETSVIPLHYALSCFYPLFAIMASVFHVEARLMALYTVRGLCVFLAVCTCYTWGFDLIVKDDKQEQHKYGCVFTAFCLILGLFAVSEHASSFMMMVRGYESKGFCAAVVAPMCTYILVQLCKDRTNKGLWNLLCLVSWASMPIAMSSMAVIPLAIAIAGIIIMVQNKSFWNIFYRCVLCVMPNMVLMLWYMLGE